MPPKKLSKSKTGFFGVRAKPSGNYGVEFQCDRYRYWLGTFKYPEVAACAYDVASWRFGRPRHEMNFPEIETQADAEFIGPKNIKIRRMEEKKKKPAILVAPGDSDNAAMARFTREHPEYVQAEREFFWKREAEQKKKVVKKEEEAGPSTVIPIESDSSDWDDSEEEDECDDPNKEEFWE